MESPPLARYIHHESKKRVFPGSSSSYMDPDVVEIAPPVVWSSGSKSKSKSKSLIQKEVIPCEVIDIDMDEDCVDLMVIDEKDETHHKGKEPVVIFPHRDSNAAKLGPEDGGQSSKKSCVRELHNSFDLDCLNSDVSYGDDEHIGVYHDDLTFDDKYAFLQAHFDSMDIPPGVEALVPWFSSPVPTHEKKDPATVSSSNNSGFSIQLDAPGTDLSHSYGLLELAQSGEKSTSITDLSLQTHSDKLGQLSELDRSSSLFFPEFAKNKKKSAASTSSSYYSNLQTDEGYPTGLNWFPLGFSEVVEMTPISSCKTVYTPHNPLDTAQLSSGIDLSSKKSRRHSRKKLVGDDNLTYSSFMDKKNLPSGVDAHMSTGQGPHMFTNKPPYMSDGFANSQTSATVAGSSSVPLGPMSGIGKYGNEDDILNRFQLFKQFDTVQDHADHHYISKGSSTKQPSKNWARKIQEEWRILEKDLPDTILVRIYESRMDLLRAVIVGAQGTPYHDGLFFFDVFFPSGYPNVPPHVYYHSGGLRLNPNLYNCGKVCLSLLNTWSGSENEKWIPGVSTMLQVLVSIQALILNEKPYFNEPGYARMNGSAGGEKNSQQYSENAFILSLKTMVYTMRRPPKHFEDFVVGHFCKCAQDILVACKAYMDGAQVGCLVKGGVQDLDAGDKSCSQHFRDTLAAYIPVLVQWFSHIGAKDCEKFLPLADKGNTLASVVPKASTFLF